MKKIDHSNLRAQPGKEDFKGKYESKNFISRSLVKNYYRAVKSLLDLTSDVITAHEVGIGEGYSTQKLRPWIPSLSGSEFVPELIRNAKHNNPGVTIFQESVYDLKKGENSVDLVFFLEVLEHLDYPEIALSEIKRISKRYLIIGVPNEPLWRILNICRFKYISNLGNTPGHLNHWSKSQIIELIQEHYGNVIAVKSPIPWTIILAEKTEIRN
ncbi:class I SAM-dependent methyltransferase [Salinimicrobium terrae]|uniref:class I SAM-dependent methyltransferase n=1 Tax=Salinimicrobium terrae TaxID=470866 RepID=UPI0004104C72|nr:class I SAM-dependent methyltransferase [Salinimicrobium terrae]